MLSVCLRCPIVKSTSGCHHRRRGSMVESRVRFHNRAVEHHCRGNACANCLVQHLEVMAVGDREDRVVGDPTQIGQRGVAPRPVDCIEPRVDRVHLARRADSGEVLEEPPAEAVRPLTCADDRDTARTEQRLQALRTHASRAKRRQTTRGSIPRWSQPSKCSFRTRETLAWRSVATAASDRRRERRRLQAHSRRTLPRHDHEARFFSQTPTAVVFLGYQLRRRKPVLLLQPVRSTS